MRVWLTMAGALLTVVGALLTVVAGHPHPMDLHGECMALTHPFEGRRMIGGGPMPTCLRGLQPPREHMRVFQYCKGTLQKKIMTTVMKQAMDTFNLQNPGPGTMPPGLGMKAPAFEIMEKMKVMMAECVMAGLDLVGEDGALNTTKILQDAVRIHGKDKGKVMYMRAVVTSCVANTTGDNATEHLKNLFRCVKEEAMEFCERRAALLKMWIQSGSEESVCSPVQIPDEPFECCRECAQEHGVDDSVCGVEEGEEREHGFRSNVTREQEWVVRLCVSKKMGWYNETTGWDFEALSQDIAQFPGWDDIPEALENITSLIVDCVPEGVEGDEEEGVAEEAVLWSACFVPKYFAICGFRSNLTRLLIPGFRRSMKEEALEFVQEAMNMDDDFMDMDDEREMAPDAEMVDAGLLESSSMEHDNPNGEIMTADGQHSQSMPAQMKHGVKSQDAQGSDHTTHKPTDATTDSPPHTTMESVEEAVTEEDKPTSPA